MSNEITVRLDQTESLAVAVDFTATITVALEQTESFVAAED